MNRMVSFAGGMVVAASVAFAAIPPEGTPAPDFVGDGWSDGGNYSWDRLAGKVVVLSFYYANG